MPNLDAIINNHTEPPRTLEGFLDTIPGDDRAKIDRLMGDANWTTDAIANVILEYSDGLVGSPSAVRRYRRRTHPNLFGKVETR